jgi:drug/metabolite transporter (DMT)-like permease
MRIISSLINNAKLTWRPIVAVFFWGLSFIATKIALREINPLLIINLRLLLAVPLLGIIAVLSKRSLKLRPRQFFLVLLLSAISVFHLWIQVTGLHYTSAANTGWIIGTTPIFIAIMSYIFLKEKLVAREFTGIGISIAGLLLLISKGDFTSLSFITGKGDLLVLASCVTWGLYSVVNRKIVLDYSPLVSIFYVFVFMAVLSFPFTLNASSVNAVLHLSAQGIYAILFLGIFCAGIAYVLWAQALNRMESANVAAFLYLEPFVTVLGAWLFLGEHLTGFMALSGLIIMLGVALVNFK